MFCESYASLKPRVSLAILATRRKSRRKDLPQIIIIDLKSFKDELQR